jgi:hypothetical protein
MSSRRNEALRLMEVVEMAQPKGGSSGSSESSKDREQKRPRRRKRTVLNLGMPFVPLDAFVNQSEDAVALGYRVLERTIDEIKNGFKEAQDFNQKQRDYNDGKRDSPPTIPWEQVVTRMQTFQDITLDALREGTDIFAEAMKSGSDSMRSVAKTWEASRTDVDAKPTMAGPVFDDPIEVEVNADRLPNTVTREIVHKGLTRLRIYVHVDEPTLLRQTAEEGPQAKLRNSVTADFKPKTRKPDEDTSVLTVTVTPHGEIAPGVYHGLIRAENFELLIARLLVRVVARQEAPFSQSQQKASGQRASVQKASGS